MGILEWPRLVLSPLGEAACLPSVTFFPQRGHGDPGPGFLLWGEGFIHSPNQLVTSLHLESFVGCGDIRMN